LLREYGHVLTEHVADGDVQVREANRSDRDIHDRDVQMLLRSDLVVAEVSTPSLGVGYEIGRALENGKAVVVLHRLGAGPLSAMVAGAPSVEVISYSDDEQALTQLRAVLSRRFHDSVRRRDATPQE
jgi:nucleoside 2-deoxyribosyltransferase